MNPLNFSRIVSIKADSPGFVNSPKQHLQVYVYIIIRIFAQVKRLGIFFTTGPIPTLTA
jgi:hypothetical protein